mgnify:CR=1 FL=1
MGKKRLFYKAIIWNVFGFVMMSVLSYLWFGGWIQSLSFSLIAVIISIFTYILYELLWNKFIKRDKWKNFLGIVVLGLLKCNFSYAENITLIKCKDVGVKQKFIFD